MRAGIALLSLGVAACAGYTPAPLDPTGEAVVDPQPPPGPGDAARARPYLRPVAIDLARPLDGNAVATIAVLANPDLRALRARAGIADAQAFAARLLPDPTFSVGASPILAGPDPFTDLVGVLGFDLDMLRTRGIRTAQATAAASQVRLDLAWAEWQTAGQARLQAARIVWLTQSAALVAASRRSALTNLQRTERAAGRGDLAADVLQSARAAAADAEEKARIVDGDLAAATAELTRLLGLPQQTMLLIAPEPQAETPLDAARLFAIARQNRTDLRALEAGYASQEAAVHKAVLDQFPTLALTITGNRDTSGNKLLGPAIDFTLPLWNRNRGGIAIEQATRAALKAEYDARLFQARAEIAGAVNGIALARRQRAAIQRDLPSALSYAEASRRAADRGDLSAATADTAEQALRDRQSQLTQTGRDIAERMIALELLTGSLREAWTR